MALATPLRGAETDCWACARRPFFTLADIEASARRKAEGKAPAPISPLALDAVRRMDALFEIERGINGRSADQRRAIRQELSALLIADLEARMRAERPKLPRCNDVAKAVDYLLKRWPAFTRFLDDGRICCRTIPPSAVCSALPLGASRGSSPAPTVGKCALPPYTA